MATTGLQLGADGTFKRVELKASPDITCTPGEVFGLGVEVCVPVWGFALGSGVQCRGQDATRAYGALMPLWSGHRHACHG
eukprot:812096-Amphidinium_carterae.3